MGLAALLATPSWVRFLLLLPVYGGTRLGCLLVSLATFFKKEGMGEAGEMSQWLEH